jgi:hypothetical protein
MLTMEMNEVSMSWTKSTHHVAYIVKKRDSEERQKQTGLRKGICQVFEVLIRTVVEGVEVGMEVLRQHSMSKHPCRLWRKTC